MTLINDTCDHLWGEADWLSPLHILDCWCRQDARCRQAKEQALLSACERGDVRYRRSDGKTFDDPVDELLARNILLIERASFEDWVVVVDGKSPLQASSRPVTVKLPPRPAWANESWVAPSQHPRPEPSTNASVAVEIKAAPSEEVESESVVVDLSATRSNNIPPASSSAIIKAFRVKEKESENSEWWDVRLRDAKRYQLLDARISKGRLKTPSYWRPDLIAFWLVEKNHLSSKTVKHIVLLHFPEWADTMDYLDN